MKSLFHFLTADKILLLVKQAPPSGTWTEIAPNTWRARPAERHVWGDATKDHWVEPAASSVFTFPRQTAQCRQLSERTKWPRWNEQQVGLGWKTTGGFLFVCHATPIFVTDIFFTLALERNLSFTWKKNVATKMWASCWALVLFSWGNRRHLRQVSIGALVKFPVFYQYYETILYVFELCPKVVTLSSRNQLLTNFETKTAGSVRSSGPELTIYCGLPWCKNLWSLSVL